MRRFKVFPEKVPENLSPAQVELHPRQLLGGGLQVGGGGQGRVGAPGNTVFTRFLSQVLLNGSEDGSVLVCLL